MAREPVASGRRTAQKLLCGVKYRTVTVRWGIDEERW
jgi:hypothetical protein